MTKLNKPVSRETAKVVNSRNVIVTLAPSGSQSEALIGIRLKGKRTEYVLALSDLYRLGALWYGQKEQAAKKAARRSGVSWRIARRQFIAEHSIPKS